MYACIIYIRVFFSPHWSKYPEHITFLLAAALQICPLGQKNAEENRKMPPTTQNTRLVHFMRITIESLSHQSFLGPRPPRSDVLRHVVLVHMQVRLLCSDLLNRTTHQRENHTQVQFKQITHTAYVKAS